MSKEEQTPPQSLRSLAEGKTDGITKTTTFRVHPALVCFAKGFNLRDRDSEEVKAHIARLVAAMRAGAFIPPVDVSVVEGKIICRDGHCRTLAAKELVKELPDFKLECRQLAGNVADAVLHMLGTGNGQLPLTPLQQGQGFLRLIRYGMKPQEIADKLGISRPTVDNGLQLAGAPPDVQEMIKEGKVSSTTARKVIKKGAAAVEALRKEVKKRDKEAPAAPKTDKPAKKPAVAKKKKVTAKHLKGTPATVDAGKVQLPAVPFATAEKIAKLLESSADADIKQFVNAILTLTTI